MAVAFPDGHCQKLEGYSPAAMSSEHQCGKDSAGPVFPFLKGELCIYSQPHVASRIALKKQAYAAYTAGCSGRDVRHV